LFDPFGAAACSRLRLVIRHVVLWKLRPHAEGADAGQNARTIKAELEGLRGRIPGLLAIEVGLNLEPSAAAYDLALVAAFESADALAAYQLHPEHARIAEFVGRVRQERVVVDYVVEG
jgi:hypothetical protein